MLEPTFAGGRNESLGHDFQALESRTFSSVFRAHNFLENQPLPLEMSLLLTSKKRLRHSEEKGMLLLVKHQWIVLPSTVV